MDFFSATNAIAETRFDLPPAQPCGCGGLPGASPGRIEVAPVPHVDLSTAVRHLTYHVWPTMHHDCWRWNLEQIAQRRHLFNGKCVLGVAYDYRSQFPDEVLQESARHGLSWDSVTVLRNTTKLGEVKTWVQRLAALSPDTAASNEVVFAAHAKGVRHADGVMQPWVTTMLEACLDDWDTVRQQLEYGLMSGCFQQVRDGHRWHYSGSFYWFRLHDIGRRNWRNIEAHYSGTETWPWLQCRRDETGCLFGRDCGDLYTTQGQLREQWERQRHALRRA